MSGPYVIRRLSELPRHDGDGRNVRLLRRELGIRAFGINVFAADAGRTVINEHTELLDVTRGHEEIYLVLSGSATFVIAGDEVVVETGAAIFVRDPAAMRSAVANEDGTEILAIGAPPGEPFEPAAWEWSWTAYVALERGDPTTALRIAEEGLVLFPGNERLLRRLDQARSELQ